MHKRRHFAFTLVELLVVIAILAILATVSVVGYLGFTERAHISNDTTLAAQLDTLVKAEDVNNPITSEDDLLKLYEKTFGVSMSTLEPESAKYGYHFWYNINEKSVILSKSKDLSNNQSLVTTLANNENQFSDSLREELVDGYYLMDGKGSALADVLTLSDDLKNKEQYVSLLNNIEKVKKDETETIYNKLNNANNNTAYVTDEGTFRKVNNPSNVKVSKSLTKTVAAMYTYKEETTTTFASLFKAKELTVDNLEESFISEENPIATLSNDEVIKLPSSITSIGTNSMFFDKTGEAYLNLTGKVESDIKDIVRIHSTNLTFMINGKQYHFESNDDSNLSEIDGEGRYPVNSISDITVNNFDVYFDDFSSPIANYLEKDVQTQAPLDKGEIQLSIKNLEITFENEGYTHIFSNFNIDLFNLLSSNITVLSIEPNGKIKLNDGGSFSDISIYSKYFNMDLYKFRLNVSKIDYVEATINGLNNNDKYTFEYSENKELSVELSFSEVGGNYGADTSYTITIENEEIISLKDKKDYSFTLLVQNIGKSLVTVNLNKYNVTVELNLEIVPPVIDAFDFTFVNIDKYLYRIGNSNDFDISKLYKENSNVNFNDLKFDYKFYRSEDYHNYELDTTNLENEELRNKLDLVTNTIKGQHVTKDSIKNDCYKFEGTGVVAIEFIATNIKNSIRYKTKTLYVEVVDGYNVYEFLNTNNHGFNSSQNLVLLNDIVWDEAASQRVFFNNKIYGNGFTIDMSVTKQTTSMAGLIQLNGSNNGFVDSKYNGSLLDNVRIIGAPYSEVQFVTGTGAKNQLGSAVSVLGNSTIANSFISGFRSPVLIRGNCYITNSVLSGGVIANIFMDTPAVVTINNLITHQADGIYNAEGVRGAGILIYESAASSNSTQMIFEGKLTQYNYVNSTTDIERLPTISGISLGSLAKELFTSSNGKFKHNINGTDYINLGVAVVSIDAEEKANVIFKHDFNIKELRYDKEIVQKMGKDGIFYANTIEGTIDDSTLANQYFIYDASSYKSEYQSNVIPKIDFVDDFYESNENGEYYKLNPVTRVIEIGLKSNSHKDIYLNKFFVSKYGYEYRNMRYYLQTSNNQEWVEVNDKITINYSSTWYKLKINFQDDRLFDVNGNEIISSTNKTVYDVVYTINLRKLDSVKPVVNVNNSTYNQQTNTYTINDGYIFLNADSYSNDGCNRVRDKYQAAPVLKNINISIDGEQIEFDSKPYYSSYTYGNATKDSAFFVPINEKYKNIKLYVYAISSYQPMTNKYVMYNNEVYLINNAACSGKSVDQIKNNQVKLYYSLDFGDVISFTIAYNFSSDHDSDNFTEIQLGE